MPETPENRPSVPQDAAAFAESSDSGVLNVDGLVSIPLAEMEFTFVRSSGPGGQNVNKVSSKARLRWKLDGGRLAPEVVERFRKLFPLYTTENGEVVIAAQTFRDAPKNKAACLEKLRAAISAALKTPKKRIPTKPTRGSILRRLDDKKRRSDKKKDRSRRNFD